MYTINRMLQALGVAVFSLKARGIESALPSKSFQKED